MIKFSPKEKWFAASNVRLWVWYWKPASTFEHFSHRHCTCVLLPIHTILNQQLSSGCRCSVRVWKRRKNRGMQWGSMLKCRRGENVHEGNCVINGEYIYWDIWRILDLENLLLENTPITLGILSFRDVFWGWLWLIIFEFVLCYVHSPPKW